MAQRFVHKISCSPKEAPDKNAQIFIEVVHAEKTLGINHCKLYYKIHANGGSELQLLGQININVKPILEKKWYQKYRQRKFEKMDLILKEGIFRPRVLEYAELINNIVNQLKKLTKIGNIINSNIIRNYVRIEARRMKLVQSIIGEELAKKEIEGILDLHKAYWNITKQIQNTHKKQKTKEALTQDDYEERIKELEEIKKEIGNAKINQEEEIQLYQRINKKYNEETT